MRWSYNLERSRSVAAWLFATALLVFAITVVGGATRLTGSGLSITEWRPITGAIPPLTQHGWLTEFAKYQQIPQYRLVNRGMSLAQFKFIYGWEWTHRLLGRLVGAVFLFPLLVFAAVKRIPRRLVWRCWTLLGLGALQGVVGWWMVASGLSQRVAVAPERLVTHLGLALFIYCFAVWTGLEAWTGRGRPTAGADPRWRAWTVVLLLAVFVQILLGALVAGNQAGLVYNDWPLMNGRLFPDHYVQGGVRTTLLHSQAAVQFNHRLFAYLIVFAVLGFAMTARAAADLDGGVRRWAGLLAGAVLFQIGLGVVTLRTGAMLPLSLAHQICAVLVLTTALILTWRVRRSDQVF